MKNPETLFIGQHLIHLNNIHSTNNFAAKLVKQTKVVSGTAILADHQTAGRGQSGNSWLTESGKNLTFSVILQPKIEIENQFLLSKITCLALIDLLHYFEIDAQIKWPNDLLVSQKKIAGILIENSIKSKYIETSILGIGLNVNQLFSASFGATSLQQINNKEYDLKAVLFQFFQFLEKWYFKMEQGKEKEIDFAYQENLYGLNRELRFLEKDRPFKGTIEGVNKIGQLEIKLNSGKQKKYNNQEIRFMLD